MNQKTGHSFGVPFFHLLLLGRLL